ncbi:hypothetical protein Barb7_02779 [Bacteroidales bacterium Barb7]|nr:hypothetical protein Barb7_02779 [Bacteroidales bacterium Barb7]
MGYIQGNLCLAVQLPPFRGNDDHTVGTLRPVNSRRIRIFQYRNVFNIGRVNIRQRIGRGLSAAQADTAAGADKHPVNHIQRIDTPVDRVIPADKESNPSARHAVV